MQWLRDELRILSSAAESDIMARSVPDTGGVYFVPAFVGLGAPHWDPDARGALFGITRGTRQEQIVRAALESIAYQTRDLVEAMEADAGESIRVRAGRRRGLDEPRSSCSSRPTSSDMPLVRPRSCETTALGAAFAAGLVGRALDLAGGAFNDLAGRMRSSSPRWPQRRARRSSTAGMPRCGAARMFGKRV